MQNLPTNYTSRMVSIRKDMVGFVALAISSSSSKPVDSVFHNKGAARPTVVALKDTTTKDIIHMLLPNHPTTDKLYDALGAEGGGFGMAMLTLDAAQIQGIGTALSPSKYLGNFDDIIISDKVPKVSY